MTKVIVSGRRPIRLQMTYESKPGDKSGDVSGRQRAQALLFDLLQSTSTTIGAVMNLQLEARETITSHPFRNILASSCQRTPCGLVLGSSDGQDVRSVERQLREWSSHRVVLRLCRELRPIAVYYEVALRVPTMFGNGSVAG